MTPNQKHPSGRQGGAATEKSQSETTVVANREMPSPNRSFSIADKSQFWRLLLDQIAVTEGPDSDNYAKAQARLAVAERGIVEDRGCVAKSATTGVGEAAE